MHGWMEKCGCRGKKTDHEDEDKTITKGRKVMNLEHSWFVIDRLRDLGSEPDQSRDKKMG